jgi:flagellar M-ring protein FliF
MPQQILQILNNARQWLGQFLSSLSPKQKRLIVLAVPVFLVLAVAGNYLFKQGYYSPLFTNLSPQDGAAVIRELEADKIPFQLRGDGSVIAVPRQIVYEARLKLAGKGIPSGGGVGFEIFEKTSFGMSEFTQQVNYLRALQGELARTINSLGAVQSSRVHLALPSRSNFLAAEEKPSASAVVELRPGYHLTTEQVDGIIHLISTSVPKLTLDRVNVIDTSGRRLLGFPAPGAGAASEGESLHQLKVRFEQELERRIETMLDPIVGSGRTVVRVNAQMSFQETQMLREQYDPNNQVVRAQQFLEDTPGKSKTAGVPGVQSNIPGGEALNQKDGAQKETAPKEGASKRSGQMVSYEVGKTTSRINEPRGQIMRTSVAVLVDGKYDGGNYAPRPPEELEQIKGIVMRAMGFDAERGDQVEVANIPFKAEPAPAISSLPIKSLPPWTTSPPLGIGAAAGAVLLGLLLFALLRRGGRRKPHREAVAQPQAPLMVKEAVEGVIDKVVVTQDPRREQLIQITRDYHEAMVRIIRTWLHEDGAQKGAARPPNGKRVEMPRAEVLH